MLSRVGLLPVFFLAVSACAQTAAKVIEPNGPAHTPNAQAADAALRQNLPTGEALNVKDFVLEREGGQFHFDQGTFYLYGPVQGRVTGAVFEGTGRFDLTVKDAGEQKSLAMLTKSGAMTQAFTSLVLRFTDQTADEIRKASTGAAGAPDGHVRSAADDLETAFRKRLHENLDLRLLADVISAGNQGRFFLASFRMGSVLTGHNVLFIVDPEGTFHASPDEVELTTWSEFELEPWAAYRMQHPDPKYRGQPAQVMDENLDVTLDRGGMMKAKAETTVTMHRDGVRVVRLNLYPTLRVAGVYSEDGAPLDFVQENKDYDPDFAVILPEPVKAGQSIRILTVYAGKDAVRADGNDTYYLMPGARETWYPSGQGRLGDFASFHMTFHIPRQLQIVATGKQVSLAPESGGMMKAVWDSGSPIPVAGFNIGDFKSSGTKTPQGFGVDAYADVGVPDMYTPLARSSTLGGLSAVGALKGEVSQGSVAIQIYSDFFGKLPYDHIALTEQTACNYGQSWPMLVYLPICGFWDTTVQHELGLLDYDASYWREVTPHEVSHQWWGQLVGFSSYRDQWMSEGFANFSVGVFLMHTSPNMNQFRDFWKEQQKKSAAEKCAGCAPDRRRGLDDGLSRQQLEGWRERLQHADLQQGCVHPAHAGDAVLESERGRCTLQTRHAAIRVRLCRQGGNHGGLEGVHGEVDAQGAGHQWQRQAGLVLRRVCLWNRASSLHHQLGVQRSRRRNHRAPEADAEQCLRQVRHACAALPDDAEREHRSVLPT